MKPLLFLALAVSSFAADFPRVIFSDDFSAEGFGKAWGALQELQCRQRRHADRHHSADF
ncbi:MAG: hypothetical protein JNN17_21110 [Verrucomicrobiaceae bacterium]|nr:hypothetical protein [Verrucomicrobiaceae bacterium]